MRQTTLATAGFERYREPTRREMFPAEMDRVVPWRQLCALIAPVYPNSGKGRTPGRSGTDAAHLLPATMVQPVGPRSGGGTL